MSKAPYLLQRPERRRSPVVFASPHSGRDYPAEMIAASVLDPLQLRSSEDAYVDRLFSDVPSYGAVLLSAVYPRAWVDLNRRADELDPALVEDVARVGLNPRIASGLGVVPRVVAGGRSIYRGKIRRAEAEARIDTVWRPYHELLKAVLDESRSLFGQAILIDCHSMPREALNAIRTARGKRPEVVIGDRYGASAAPGIVAAVEAAFRAQGFVVSRNVPFAGAYVAQHYGRPSSRCHAIQVEIDRSLYMNERTLVPRSDFPALRTRISAAARSIAEIGIEGLPLAAE
ncbi:N-formylglutamate amidohydrolase [Celeribacter ethanolicus]|uniref:N-formylglutamate amidohydrolase n=1 Tax=Celeribacter ethanolicus TaxID=1758178 RepID=A0A291GDQ6_9RHOB|nr:N-formylglutamate amidohydrolase [Celeribacter ethanolicus]ATG48164.1 N-formylglutamate amidohydrolase [Celeribacter ethanolicus]